MFVKRSAEIRLLEEQYVQVGNNLVILYGRKGMGKTALLTEFLAEKPSVYYYQGTECVDKLQLMRMNHQAFPETMHREMIDYPILFSELIGAREDKTVIVLDEFHYIIKSSPNFIETFRLLSNTNRHVMFILSSSSVRWVETEMINDFGNMASHITAYLKLKSFTFVDFVNRFPKSSVETCIYINAILGGVPEYLDEWRENKTVQENIKLLLLNKNSKLFTAPQQFLKLELREPAVYNTILSALAEGNRKLNDLHAITEFSRAKISVYLKHLIELDLVEKLTPLSEAGKENVQKGLYRITDNFFSFWYRFVFPNLSDLMLKQTDRVYTEKIAPFLTDYIGEYFADVCTEFMKLMNVHQRLPEKILWWDRWYGKNGTIDIHAQSETGKILVGKCIWEDRIASVSDYKDLISLATDAEQEPFYCYLFSRRGFSNGLVELTEMDKNIRLIGMEDL